MKLYFEITHKFRGNNCAHNIDIRKNTDEIRYKHNIVSVCNSDEYREFGNDGEECEDYFRDLFECEYEYTHEEELFMVFSFYENSINIMNIYKNQTEANSCFNRMMAESHIQPIYDEISVLENDKYGNKVYTLYHKNDGVYMLPDKAQRVVLQKFNINSNDTIYI
jgi:hypothetical protein